MEVKAECSQLTLDDSELFTRSFICILPRVLDIHQKFRSERHPRSCLRILGEGFRSWQGFVENRSVTGAVGDADGGCTVENGDRREP